MEVATASAEAVELTAASTDAVEVTSASAEAVEVAAAVAHGDLEAPAEAMEFLLLLFRYLTL